MFIRKKITKRCSVALSSVTFIVVLSVWIVLTYGEMVAPHFLSSPTEVFKATVSMFCDENFLNDIFISIARITIGFMISAIIAIPLGIAISCFPVCNSLFSPLLSFVRYLPVPALLPLCILWFGIDETEKVIVIFIGVFFQLVFMIVDVIDNVPEDLLDISYTLGAKTKEAIFKVIIPYSAPDIWDNLRIAMGWAWGWVMLAELVGANSGIGFMIAKSQRYLLNANIIVGLLFLGFLGILTDLFFRVSGKLIFKWK